MDETVISGEEAIEEKVAENDISGQVHTEDVEMKETAGDSPSAAELDEADEEVTERLSPNSAPKDGDNLCTVCGFSAKCPRSLKIHFARKHGKMSDKAAQPLEKSANISNVSPAGIQQEADMEAESGAEVKQEQDSDRDELRSVASDNGTNMKDVTEKQSVLDKQQVEQEGTIPAQERRVSKRIPKPKIIHSCNYCGQEFRDKAPLDVHIQRYHTKDTPYTCEYILFSTVLSL